MSEQGKTAPGNPVPPSFKHPTAKTTGVITIGSVDEKTLTVEAQYNPKELQIDRTVPWQKNPQSNKAPEKGIQLEFTGAEGRTMAVEMLFDGYEKNDTKAVMDNVKVLNTLASVRKPGNPDENLRRPHLCVVTWGKADNSMWGTSDNKFQCVIDSLSIKYTMFSPEGEPLRATCTVHLKEADVVKMAADDGAGGGSPTSGTSTGAKK
jgi:hypothetical protein